MQNYALYTCNISYRYPSKFDKQRSISYCSIININPVVKSSSSGSSSGCLSVDLIVLRLLLISCAYLAMPQPLYLRMLNFKNARQCSHEISLRVPRNLIGRFRQGPKYKVNGIWFNMTLSIGIFMQNIGILVRSITILTTNKNIPKLMQSIMILIENIPILIGSIPILLKSIGILPISIPILLTSIGILVDSIGILLISITILLASILTLLESIPIEKVSWYKYPYSDMNGHWYTSSSVLFSFVVSLLYSPSVSTMKFFFLACYYWNSNLKVFYFTHF